jgi:hypothetical protein
MEFNAKGINKGSALKELLRLLNLTLDDVVAIGDNNNDLPMLEIAGVGAAVGTWGYQNAEGADRLGLQVGVLGDVAFGIRFNKPVTLSLDYRPTIYFLHDAWAHGFYGVGLTCTYNF